MTESDRDVSDKETNWIMKMLKKKKVHYGCCNGCGEMNAITDNLLCYKCIYVKELISNQQSNNLERAMFKPETMNN